MREKPALSQSPERSEGVAKGEFTCHVSRLDGAHILMMLVHEMKVEVWIHVNKLAGITQNLRASRQL